MCNPIIMKGGTRFTPIRKYREGEPLEQITRKIRELHYGHYRERYVSEPLEMVVVCPSCHEMYVVKC